MDIQDKLTINHVHASKKEEYDIDKIRKGEIVFQFNEYEIINIRLDSNKYKVNIECVSFIENEEYKWTDNNILFLENGVDYTISLNPGDERELSYIPGKYQMTIYGDREQFTCYFEVLYNNNVGQQGVNNIIELIENFISGLSIDFFNNAPVIGLQGKGKSRKFYIHQILAQEINNIRRVSQNITNDIRFNLHNEIVLESYEKKQNAKTIRKNIFNHTNKVYNVKKVADFNTNENIMLKKYLTKIFDILNSPAIKINKILNRITTERNELSLKASEYRNQLASAKSLSERDSLFNGLRNLDNNLENYKDWIDKLTTWKEVRKEVKMILENILNIKEFKEININQEIKLSRDFYFNHNLLYVKNLYDKLSGSNTSYMVKEEVFSTKKTYQLFEIYGFIIIQNILKELGFTSDLSNMIVMDFVSDTKFTFFKDEYKVEVVYDHFCEKYLLSENDKVVNLNSKHDKPDYIIKVYKDNALVDLQILEIKYRNLVHIADKENESNKLDSTLEDYYQLAYKDKNGQLIRGVVSKLMILYPSYDETIFNRHGIAEFIGINAALDFDESSAYKLIYSNLQSAIESDMGNKQFDFNDIDYLFDSLIS